MRQREGRFSYVTHFVDAIYPSGILDSAQVIIFYYPERQKIDVHHPNIEAEGAMDLLFLAMHSLDMGLKPVELPTLPMPDAFTFVSICYDPQSTILTIRHSNLEEKAVAELAWLAFNQLGGTYEFVG